MDKWFFIFLSVAVICFSVETVVSNYNKNQLEIAAINNGLQQCLEKNDNTTATVKVYKKECSK